VDAPNFALCGKCAHRDVRGCVLVRDELRETFERIEHLATLCHIALPPISLSVSLSCMNALNWTIKVDLH
jgi:hypothetical protein